MPQPVYSGREGPQLNMGLDGQQEFGYLAEEKVLFSVPGIDLNF